MLKIWESRLLLEQTRASPTLLFKHDYKSSVTIHTLKHKTMQKFSANMLLFSIRVTGALVIKPV